MIRFVRLRSGQSLRALGRLICLQANFKDTNVIDAYTSGWGTLADALCTTIDQGPSKVKESPSFVLKAT